MSERTHSLPAELSDMQPATIPGGFSPPPSPSPSPVRRKLLLLVGGSVAVFLIGGILFQIFRPQSGAAGPDDGAARQKSRRLSMSRVLAKIDGHPITWREVADECMRRYGRDVMDNLINRMIIQQACAKRRIVVTNAEVVAEVRRIAQKFNLTVENWYQMLQAERGITPQQYQRDVIWPMLALRKIAGTKVEITKRDMQEGFAREYGPRVKAKLIMVDNPRRAGKVHDEARRNPADFGRLAQRYSIEPNSRVLGGEIPPIRRFGGNKKIEDQAFRMRPGEISPVIQIGKRFVILKCEGRTKPVVKSMSEVQQALYEQIKEEKTQAAVAQVFEKLKRETTVDNFLTGSRTGIQQASGTKPAPGSTRISSPYALPGNAKRRSPTFR
ncbi:MAG: peptidylprolyl isomerase [Planctomycetaceae bacterium]